MTLFHVHDNFAAPAGESRFTLARAWEWFAATLRTIHEAIMAAKTRRLQRELTFHADFGEGMCDRPLGEQDVWRIPQRPMILGDKWDF
jgi:hypothetical protein